MRIREWRLEAAGEVHHVWQLGGDEEQFADRPLVLPKFGMSQVAGEQAALQKSGQPTAGVAAAAATAAWATWATCSSSCSSNPTATAAWATCSNPTTTTQATAQATCSNPTAWATAPVYTAAAWAPAWGTTGTIHSSGIGRSPHAGATLVDFSTPGDQ